MPATPARANDLLAWVKRIENRMDEADRRTLYSVVISSGGLTIRDLGGITAQDLDGDTTFFTGGFGGDWSRPDGTAQPITYIADDRGAWRIAVFDNTPNSGVYRQFAAVFDYSGNIVLGDDAESGQGLARPYIPLSVSAAQYKAWPATAATGWETLETIRYCKQHPRIDVHLRATTDTDPATRGEVRLREQGGTVIGPVHAIEYAQTLRYSNGPVPGDFSDLREVHLEARRTAGTGVVRATVAYAAGVQS
ncbi:hypothetical protein NLX83_21585 [Allokutzneria sp. A3M-2-11 16]|uniref:hypothetical protein n=1 Tax=Allokutzneria sp. A3M-2-11 16 TaxID=2962043 RepID=UPI0020B6A489|nr:hypothetical protein [Allokutzneria sp. A3M-2-11 16]MCP3801862.1 hypothetical protein [Allokutzneria sp. A3M-2-11 16]